MAVSEESGPLRGNRPPQRLGERVGVHADENVPAGLDGLDPLGLAAERDARDAGQVRLLLHATRVRRDGRGVVFEGDHRQVADRVDGDHAQLVLREGGEIAFPLSMVARVDPELPLYDVRLMDQRLADIDILALPTTPIVAPTMQEVAPADEFARRNAMLLRNTLIVNFFDLCAISVPIPREGGLPAGLMLVARNGQDNRLFRIAMAVERLFGG